MEVCALASHFRGFKFSKVLDLLTLRYSNCTGELTFANVFLSGQTLGLAYYAYSYPKIARKSKELAKDENLTCLFEENYRMEIAEVRLSSSLSLSFSLSSSFALSLSLGLTLSLPPSLPPTLSLVCTYS